MRKYIPAIEYMRGIGMLGVLGIHTGAYSLSNPHVNIHLFALLEILSRFCVPIFFFVSAFGLFLGHSLTDSFSYRSFFIRRIRTVLIPYVIWSLLYMAHYTWISGDHSLWIPDNFVKTLEFGLASYQLYFLVILLWFYICMPIWRFWLGRICQHPVAWFIGLLPCQILFNYYSSYILTVPDSPIWLSRLLEYRLNYWVSHYFYIFLLGGYFALQFDTCQKFMIRHTRLLWAFGSVTALGMLTSFYWYHLHNHVSLENTVDTIHQLSPMGVLYTIGATLALFAFFETRPLPSLLSSLLHQLGKHSYVIYLIHPFFMYYGIDYLMNHQLTMSFGIIILFYLSVLLGSIGASVLLQFLSKYTPLPISLLTGAVVKKKG